MRSILVGALVAFSVSAFAQQAPVGAQKVSNEPGKVSVAESVKASAAVTSINKSTRALTLKNAQGKSFEVVAGPEVKNFDQIKVGDEVVVAYVRALAMELKKGGAGVRERTDSARGVVANPGEKPAVGVGQEIVVMADVVKVDEKAKIISLKGPNGNVVDLDVKNPEHFKVVKKGDQVEVSYFEAVAVAVEPAPKKAAKAK